jgi:ribosome-binding factor A
MKMNRLERVNQLIKRELANIFLKELDLPSGVFATITKVETSKTLEHCTVFVSVFPEKKANSVLKQIESKIFDIQKKLDKKLKMKFVPKISFKKEENLERAAKIEGLFHQLEKEVK